MLIVSSFFYGEQIHLPYKGILMWTLYEIIETTIHISFFEIDGKWIILQNMRFLKDLQMQNFQIKKRSNHSKDSRF